MIEVLEGLLLKLGIHKDSTKLRHIEIFLLIVSVKYGWNGLHPRQNKLISPGYLIKQEFVRSSASLFCIIKSWTELQHDPVLYT